MKFTKLDLISFRIRLPCGYVFVFWGADGKGGGWRVEEYFLTTNWFSISNTCSFIFTLETPLIMRANLCLMEFTRDKRFSKII